MNIYKNGYVVDSIHNINIGKYNKTGISKFVQQTWF